MSDSGDTSNLFATNRVSKKVVQEIKGVAKKSIEEGEALKELGNEALKAKALDKAIDYYTQAIEKVPSSAVYYSNRSAAKLRKGDSYTSQDDVETKQGTMFSDALSDAEHAVVLDSNYIKGYIRKVICLERLERYTHALRTCDEALAVDPTDQYFVDAKVRIAKAKDAAGKPRSMNEMLMKVTVMNNPNFPIKCDPFDKTGTAPHPKYNREVDNVLAHGDNRAIEATTLAALKNVPTAIEGIPREVVLAHDRAIEAYAYRSLEEKKEIANAALRLSKICPEAYNILAESASTIEEAISLFDQGISAGPSVYSNIEKFNEICSKGKVWDHHLLRGYHRCLFGKANLLRKMGRYKESLEIFNKLMSIDKEYHGMQTSYINYRILVVDVLLSLHKYKECKIFIEENDKFFSMQSSAATRIYTLVLLDYILKGKTEDKLVALLLGSSRKPAPYITGVKKLPDRPEGINMGAQYSLTNAISYVRYHKKHWDDHPGSIAFLKNELLKRIVNTIDDAIVSDNYDHFIKFFRKYEYYDIPRNYVKYTQLPPLHRCSYAGRTKMAQYLLTKDLDLNYQIKFDRSNLTALHMACYNGRLDIVKMLVEKGADMTVYDAQGLNPAHMAANQGEHLCMKYLLDVKPELAKIKSADGLPFVEMCFGSVPTCIVGVEKCQRCLGMGAHAHSPNVDMTKCVKILLDRGLDVNQVDPYGETLLHWAARSYLFGAMVLFLPLMSTATKNKQDKKSKFTALHLMIQKPDQKGIYLNAVRLLAEHVNLELKDFKGYTALETCLKAGDSRAASILQQAGAKMTNEAAQYVKKCTFCNKSSAEVKSCPCKKAAYCSKECQTTDWKRHKATDHPK